jgi:hemerythrin-like domain-containing protein
MRRSEALTSLSHQHHEGLYVALQLKRARPETAADARRAFLDFFEREASHFRTEEELLLPAFARHCDPSDPAIVRVLVEHVELRRRGQDLAGAGAAPDVGELHDLGERLESHIRHEERELFPRIEEALSSDELEELAAALEGAEARAD